MINVSGVVQCAFIVKDIKEAVDFYQNVFGFSVVRNPEQDWPCAWLQIQHDQQLHLIERTESEQFLHPESVRHLAFSVSDLQVVVPKLIQLQLHAFCYDPQGNQLELNPENINLMGTKAVFFRDPYNNLIKLVQMS